jgi:hypothetical protein
LPIPFKLAVAVSNSLSRLAKRALIGEGDMNKQKALASYLQENQTVDLMKDDIFVNITLYRIPSSLVKEFALRIAIHYPGGIGEAIQNLMKKAIK